VAATGAEAGAAGATESSSNRAIGARSSLALALALALAAAPMLVATLESAATLDSDVVDAGFSGINGGNRSSSSGSKARSSSSDDA